MLQQRTYSDEQKEKRALIKASLAKSDSLKLTKKVINEHLKHTRQWKAVAAKYVEYVWLLSEELLHKYPELVRRAGAAQDQVDPWV